MLKQLNIRATSGNIPDQDRQGLDQYIDLFETILISHSQNLPPRILRAKLAGSVYIIRDPNKIVLVYIPKSGHNVNYIDSDKNVIPSELAREISMELDYDDFSIAILPRHAMTLPKPDQEKILLAAAQDLIQRAVSEFTMKSAVSAFSPIFGPNQYPVQSKLVFVLMPFQDRLSTIYQSIVRSSIEDDLKMVCRRADEIKSTNPVMQDIWKSICECRIVLADLTDFNPNVMYELGIAHTIGKPSLIIYQDQDTAKKFPFDLAHIRRINYEDNAAGGAKLRSEITAHIRAMVEFET